jgi:sec-independent protein translocase protein TatA
MGLENPLHVAIILLVLLLLFGAKKLPEMGRGLGDGMREFKDSISGKNDGSPAIAAEADRRDARD